jgi:hypothetical protein
MGAPNFTLLDSSLPEIGRLISAMLQARDAVERRSWSHPQEPEHWWADVLADPRARKRERRTDLAVNQAFYRLADEKRDIRLRSQIQALEFRAKTRRFRKPLQTQLFAYHIG